MKLHYLLQHYFGSRRAQRHILLCRPVADQTAAVASKQAAVADQSSAVADQTAAVRTRCTDGDSRRAPAR